MERLVAVDQLVARLVAQLRAVLGLDLAIHRPVALGGRRTHHLAQDGLGDTLENAAGAQRKGPTSRLAA